MSRFCFQIGDEVCVVDRGKTYSTYDEFVRKYAEKYISGFEEHYVPSDETTGKIVGRGLHERDMSPLYVIENESGKVFIIGETGLELISKINEEEFLDILNAF